jgi:ribosomal-protein-alanine N-acetyltransferase
VNNAYILRYMRHEDIPQVVEVDKLSFPIPWSSRSYLFEINDNDSAHMVVIETEAAPRRANGLMGMLRRLGGPVPIETVAGYGGFWLIDGEAHISTIAVHPDYRGRGFGEILLAGMLARSIALKAEYSVLEVRVSNTNAINLYRKYEFEIVGRRKNYYRDNNEDAFLMHLAPIDDAYRVRFAERVAKLQDRVAYQDLFTEQPVR